MIALVGSLDPLTAQIATTLRAQGRAHVLCSLATRTDLDPPPGQPILFRVENLGTLLRRLGDMGVRDVCFAGAVRRPAIDPDRIDDATRPFVPILLDALERGDDGALRAVLGLFEAAGFSIVAAHALVPELLPPPGLLARARPTPRHVADAARAEAVHRLLAPADLGQGLVVRAAQVLAVEAQPGTDFMLRSVREVAAGALFYKAPKRGQDRRADLPVIGPATLERAREAQLSAIVVEAGGVMVLRAPDCAALADEAGIVLWVRERSA